MEQIPWTSLRSLLWHSKIYSMPSLDWATPAMGPSYGSEMIYCHHNASKIGHERDFLKLNKQIGNMLFVPWLIICASFDYTDSTILIWANECISVLGEKHRKQVAGQKLPNPFNYNVCCFRCIYLSAASAYSPSLFRIQCVNAAPFPLNYLTKISFVT